MLDRVDQRGKSTGRDGARGRGWRRSALLVPVLALLLSAAAPVDDPLLDRQYHLKTVRTFPAWEEGRGADQIIAVLDTGVDLRHPDLVHRLVPGIDLVDSGTPPMDRNGHGTFVAGVAVAAADNDEGGAGVAPRAKVMPVRVLNDEGAGTSDVVAEGIRWAARNGATVINLSLADAPGQERAATDLITTDVELAIRQAALDDIVVVAAAGNEGSPTTPYAEDLPALIVGASDKHDAVWKHSNRDDRTLFAPGVKIISTYVGDPYAEADGTSFAAPIVSAAAALLRQSGLDAEQVRKRLAVTARPVGEGTGRVDIAAALGIAPRERTTPSPRPKPPEPGPAPDDAGPAQTKPRPVPRPVPIDPAKPAKPRKSPKPEPPVRTEVAQVPQPAAGEAAGDAPVAATDSARPATEVAAPPLAAAGASRPLWPFILAGLVLFGVVIALGGYVTARRSR